MDVWNLECSWWNNGNTHMSCVLCNIILYVTVFPITPLHPTHVTHILENNIKRNCEMSYFGILLGISSSLHPAVLSVGQQYASGGIHSANTWFKAMLCNFQILRCRTILHIYPHPPPLWYQGTMTRPRSTHPQIVLCQTRHRQSVSWHTPRLDEGHHGGLMRTHIFCGSGHFQILLNILINLHFY